METAKPDLNDVYAILEGETWSVMSQMQKAIKGIEEEVWQADDLEFKFSMLGHHFVTEAHIHAHLRTVAITTSELIKSAEVDGVIEKKAISELEVLVIVSDDGYAYIRSHMFPTPQKISNAGHLVKDMGTNFRKGVDAYIERVEKGK
jgi:hypothetical protein